ncbi:MAG: hypothetical protein HQL02_10405 [Nitrospirae bacterium]|nr:hypothetical protein [Nitrospirota bacterium]
MKTQVLLDAFGALNNLIDKYFFSDSKKEMPCWQYMKCSMESKHTCDAVNKKAGRRCWLVVGSLSGIKERCKNKFENCKDCDFYIKVKNGEI